MEVLFFIIVIAVALVRSAVAKEAREQKGKPGSAPAPSSGKTSSTAVHAAHTGYRAANKAYNDAEVYRPNRYHSDSPAPAGRQFADQSFDTAHYHSEGYDFDTCVSFSGLPLGTDELAYLARLNARHEKDLEKLLQISEQ